MSDRQLTRLLRSDPDTAHFVSEAQVDITIPGIAQRIPYDAYREPSSWIGYALISGRWFSQAGEVVVPTKLISEAHLRLDQSDGDLLLRGAGRRSRLQIHPHSRIATRSRFATE